jgi:hypothetical protein
MIRTMWGVQTILIASTTVVLAQGNHGPPVSHGTAPTQVLGATGTMYDGNNTNLQLPSELDRYWSSLWSGWSATGNCGLAVLSGTGSAAIPVNHPHVGVQY